MLRRFIAAFIVLAGTALAHPGPGGPADFTHGFGHPLAGLDHILAMVTVGVLAVALGRRATWLLPAGFLAAMAAGGALGMADVRLPFVELAIAGSVLVFGLLVASPRRPPAAVAACLVAAFAVFHGHAHGAEMPAAVSGLSYGVGFLAGTLVLHAAGMALGWGAARLGAERGGAAFRWAGTATGLAGLALLAGAA